MTVHKVVLCSAHTIGRATGETPKKSGEVRPECLTATRCAGGPAPRLWLVELSLFCFPRCSWSCGLVVAWLLGSTLTVAPVIEGGSTSAIREAFSGNFGVIAFLVSKNLSALGAGYRLPTKKVCEIGQSSFQKYISIMADTSVLEIEVKVWWIVLY